MAFKIAGRFIALSQVTVVPSTDPNKQPLKKQEIYLDCTRFDGITYEQIGKENKILLEFGGDKVLDKIKGLNLQKDDVINVTFDLIGNPTKDKTTGKLKVFTAIRCYDVDIIRRAGQVVQPATQAAAPQPTPEPQPSPVPEPQPNPIPAPSDDPNGGLPF